jgi:hypothetical protein
VDTVNPWGNAMARKQAKGTKMAATIEARPQSVRLELPADLHRQFRVEAAKEGQSMAAVARQLVEEWVKGRKAGAK